LVSAFCASFSVTSLVIAASDYLALAISAVRSSALAFVASTPVARVVSSEIFLSSSDLAPSRAVVSALAFTRF
jgi:hypothetical protein